MKHDKIFYINLLICIAVPILIVLGAITTQISDNNRIKALGGLLILIPLTVLCFWGVYILSSKEQRQKERQKLIEKQAREKRLTDALAAFENKSELPETNTLTLVENGLKFKADGTYLCKENFKGIAGHHLAIEICATDLISKPIDFDDVCDLESVGVKIELGYHDGDPLETVANDNGVILADTLQNSVGKTISLEPDKGYIARVTTVEGDCMDYGFIKIIGIANDILKVYFSMTVSYGLCDTAEGVVELYPEPSDDCCDIRSLIAKTKCRRYNTLDVSAEQAQAIKNGNPFLPESYITFLREIGFADLDWIDVGRDCKTPSNLYDSETDDMKSLLAKCDGKFDLEDLYFIAIDNGDTYYAFSKTPGDGKVYIFSEDTPDSPPFDDFEHFLKEILSA